MHITNSAQDQALCFVAGKSGGHIIPCLTLAQQEKEKNNTTRVLFFSTRSALDMRILQQHTCKHDKKSNTVDTHVALPLSGVSLKKWYLLPKIGLDFVRSVYTSFKYLRRYRPAKVVSTGGYIALPVVLAARMLRIPVELYELNVQPGKAVQWLAPHVNTVRICFAKTADLLQSRLGSGSRAVPCELTAYPVRFHASAVQRDQHTKELLFGHEAHKKTLFIIGGSQGSQFLNQAVQHALQADPALARSVTIIHQTGQADVHAVKDFYQQAHIPAHVFAYSDQIEAYYQAADVVISRAGAGGLFEILFFKKPCIVIPLEMAHDSHQYENAREMVAAHPDLFFLVRQTEITKESTVLARQIRNLVRV